MAESSVSPSTLNIFLTIWGGLVPLAVGWFTNWWNRKIQLEDRQFEEEKNKRLLDRSDLERKTKNLVAYKQESMSETRRLILNFLDKSNLYVQTAIKIHSVPLDVRNANSIEELQLKQIEVTNSFNEVFIKVNDKSLLSCCRKLLNESTQYCPDFSKIPTPIEFSDYAAKCADKRSGALDVARKYLKSLEKEILDLET